MKKIVLKVLAVVLAAVLLILVAGAVPIIGSMDGRGEPGGQVLIVLGTTVNGTEPSPMLRQRLDAAVQYLNTYPEARCIVTGGKGDAENLSEAQCMFNYLTAAGIDAARITMEDRATSTAENFAFSKAIIDEQLGKDASIGFVTTRFHVYRAGRVAQKGGIPARGLGAPDVWYLAINNFLRECVGICWYTVKGWI